jgi:hypothetical protein
LDATTATIDAMDAGSERDAAAWSVNNPAGSRSEPAGAGGSNRFGGLRGQFPVPHTVDFESEGCEHRVPFLVPCRA